MGFWSRVSKVLHIIETVAPILPIPQKVKAGVAKGGEIEHKVEDIIRKPGE
jgi:hypothetical protein